MVLLKSGYFELHVLFGFPVFPTEKPRCQRPAKKTAGFRVGNQCFLHWLHGKMFFARVGGSVFGCGEPCFSDTQQACFFRRNGVLFNGVFCNGWFPARKTVCYLHGFGGAVVAAAE